MPVEILKILEPAEQEAAIDRAVAALNAGELVVLPTETVYGAAGRLDRREAVARLSALRTGASGPFTVHLPSAEPVRDYVGPLSDLGLRMTQKLWPGPVALVFDVPADVRAATSKKLGLKEADLYVGGAITLRCPDHRITNAILARVDGPVALARAATSGGDEPFDDASVSALGDSVSLVIDAGRTRYSKPSTIVHVQDGHYRVVRDGVLDARIIERQLKTTVLFVCSGNTCRSPMAGALARKLLKHRFHVDEAELETKGIEVISAGSFAMPGLRATPQAVDAVAELGADLSTHRSRQLTPELIHSADFIFTMGQAHAQSVLGMVPTAAGRVLPLDPSGEVDDPIGGDLAVYQTVAQKFQKLIEDRFEQTVFKLHPPEVRS